MRQRDIFKKRSFFDTADVQEIFRTVRVPRCLNECIHSDNGNATRLKVNSTELMQKNESAPLRGTLKLNWANFKRTLISAV